MYLLNVLFYKQHNLNLRCKNSMWFYDVVYFFSCLKGFTWIVFSFEWCSYKFFFCCCSEKNESLVMLLNQNTTFIVCMLVNDWKGLGFNGLFFSHWMMLVQVFLILMCIIFEHGSVAFTVGTVSSCSRSWTLLEDLEALLGWVTDRRVCWVKGVDWSMPCYCQTVTVNIGNLHLPASFPPFSFSCDIPFWVRIASL